MCKYILYMRELTEKFIGQQDTLMKCNQMSFMLGLAEKFIG